MSARLKDSHLHTYILLCTKFVESKTPTDTSPPDPRHEHIGVAKYLVEPHDRLSPVVVHLDGLRRGNSGILELRRIAPRVAENKILCVFLLAYLFAPCDLDDLLALRPEGRVELEEDLHSECRMLFELQRIKGY